MESLQNSVGDTGLEPVEYLLSEGEERLCYASDMRVGRLKGGIEPGVKKLWRATSTGQKNLLELEFQSIGMACLAEAVFQQEIPQPCLLRRRQGLRVTKPPKPGSAKLFELTGFRSPGFIHRSVEHGNQVELVQGDAGMREGSSDTRQVGRAHITGELLNLFTLHSATLEEREELRKCNSAPPLTSENGSAVIKVSKHRDVVMAPPSSGLIDSDSTHFRQVQSNPATRYIANEEPPKARVGHAKFPGDRVDRHLGHEPNR